MAGIQPGGKLPPSGSGPLPSPSSKLAAFNPFQTDLGLQPDSSPLASRPLGALDYRNRDPFRGWDLLAQAEQQPSQPAAAMDSLMPSGFASRRGYGTSSDATYGTTLGGSTSPDHRGDLMSPTYSPAQARTTPASRGHGRRFLVQNVPTDIECLDLIKQFPKQEYPSMIGPHMIDLNTKGRFYIGFSDIREAKRFVSLVDNKYFGWELISVHPDEFQRETRLLPLPINFDDSVLVTLYCGSRSSVSPANVVSKVKPILDLVGDVHSIQEVHFGHPSRGARLTVHELIVRYFNSNNATNAIRALNATRTEDFVMEVIPYHAEMENQAPRHWTATGKSRRYDQQPATPNRRGYMSPGGDPDGSPVPIPDRGFGGNTQAINLGQINYQRDTRTTIMLRNIPAVMTWMDLKRILDSTSLNRYDFMYLRMDFENNQNVGYAFVNFRSPLDIHSFVDARVGRTWPGFLRYGDKIAEMSYATVQGKDALVEKFRNSPVILNSADNRPKLFHMDGRFVGHEATFPPVNNFYILSKGVDRSQRNGLYRSGTRTDPHIRPQYYRYPDRVELPQQAVSDRERGSPIRAPRDVFDLGIASRTALQPWNATSRDPRSG